MNLFIITTLVVAVATAALGQGQGQGQAPNGKTLSPQGYYPPYQNQYSDYPYNPYNNQYGQGVKGVTDPSIDYSQPQGFLGGTPVSLSPLEAALAQIDHQSGGHSEKYYYGRHSLGPFIPPPLPSSFRSSNVVPRQQQFSRPRSNFPGGDPYNYRARHHNAVLTEYPNINKNLNYEVEYPYPYPIINGQQYQQQQYYNPQPQPYPYNTYYPPSLPYLGEVGVGVPDIPYVNAGVKTGGSGSGSGNGGKKPFTVNKKPHYEVYLYE